MNQTQSRFVSLVISHLKDIAHQIAVLSEGGRVADAKLLYDEGLELAEQCDLNSDFLYLPHLSVNK